MEKEEQFSPKANCKTSFLGLYTISNSEIRFVISETNGGCHPSGFLFQFQISENMKIQKNRLNRRWSRYNKKQYLLKSLR
jgi:hypothetical protein